MAVNRNLNQGVEITPLAATDNFEWDSEVPQLAARRRGNAHTWVVQTRHNGKTLRTKIADVADVSIEEARAQALNILENPKTKGDTLSADISIDAFAERFLLDCQHQWKPSTLKSHGQCVKKQILPALGQLAVAELDRETVVRWHRCGAGSEGTRNRALAVLSSMIRHAELLGLRRSGQNPCAGLRRHQSEFKAEYLDINGYAELDEVLRNQAEHFPRAVSCLRFIILTGCRSGEAKAARSDQRDGARIALPDAKSGPKSIWLGKPARSLLASLPNTGPKIFAGEDEKRLDREMTKLWKIVRARLGRPSVRMHDLRHSFASVAVNIGFDLRIVGGLLGHQNIETTAGYVHLDKSRVEVASERVGKHLDRAFGDTGDGSSQPPKHYRLQPRRRTSFERFVTSRQSVPEFCNAEGLDPSSFLPALIKWRAQNGGRA